MIEIHYTKDQLATVIDSIIPFIQGCFVVTIRGTLGAGKTTLVTQLLQRYGVKEAITSPTFSYMNTYYDASGNPIYHFDLYRIESVDAFLSAGFEEYLYQSKSLAVIEWPEIIMPLVTHQVCHIELEYGDDIQSRRMRIAWVKKDN